MKNISIFSSGCRVKYFFNQLFSRKKKYLKKVLNLDGVGPVDNRPSTE